MAEQQPAPVQSGNILGTEKVGTLILKFALPAIIGNIVNALYNIVDQIFIGQGVGMLGNAATNVAMPLTTVSTAMALLLGVGCASNFNLNLGAGRKERAGQFAAAGIGLLAIVGVALMLVVQLFLPQLLQLFGSTEKVYPFALTYTRITALGIPLVLFSTGCSQLIRADGSPTYSMVCMLSGAVANTILDPLFIFTFNMGIAGAAWATVTGQVLSAVMGGAYLFRYKTVKLKAKWLKPRWGYAKRICSLGAAACFNQLAMMLVQIVMNNVLTYYGAQSQYGSDIPLACVGVITKVNIVLMAIVVGTAQGCQPINGYNYGAKNYARVKETYKKAAIGVTIVSTIAFVLFQLFPRQIVGIFGSGSEAYFRFAERYMRIYMMLVFTIGLQPVTSNFFTSIGKAKIGIIMSMTRQIIFLLPLILLFSHMFGIDGVMYAGPVSDFAAAAVALIAIRREMKLMTQLQWEQQQGGSL